MNKKVGELLWKVGEVVVLSVIGSVATKAGDILSEKLVKKTSMNEEIIK